MKSYANSRYDHLAYGTAILRKDYDGSGAGVSLKGSRCLG
ncbi:hypothetical protein GCM10023310_28780 [Paenibacillus vulneris]